MTESARRWWVMCLTWNNHLIVWPRKHYCSAISTHHQTGEMMRLLFELSNKTKLKFVGCSLDIGLSKPSICTVRPCEIWCECQAHRRWLCIMWVLLVWLMNILFLQSFGLDWLKLATSQMHWPVLYVVKPRMTSTPHCVAVDWFLSLSSTNVILYINYHLRNLTCVFCFQMFIHYCIIIVLLYKQNQPNLNLKNLYLKYV